MAMVEEFDWPYGLDGGVVEVDERREKRRKLKDDIGHIERMETVEELSDLRERLCVELDSIDAGIAGWHEQAKEDRDHGWYNQAKYNRNAFERAIRKVDWKARMLAREGTVSFSKLLASVPGMTLAEINGMYMRTLEQYRRIHAERRAYKLLPDRDDEALRKNDGALVHYRALLVAIRREVENRVLDLDEDVTAVCARVAETEAARADAAARKAEAERARTEAAIEVARLQNESSRRRHEEKVRRMHDTNTAVVGMIRERGLLGNDVLAGLFQEAMARVGRMVAEPDDDASG